MKVDGYNVSDYKIKTYKAHKRNVSARLDYFGIGNLEIKMDNGINQCLFKLSMDEVAVLREILNLHFKDEYGVIENEQQ